MRCSEPAGSSLDDSQRSDEIARGPVSMSRLKTTGWIIDPGLLQASTWGAWNLAVIEATHRWIGVGCLISALASDSVSAAAAAGGPSPAPLACPTGSATFSSGPSNAERLPPQNSATSPAADGRDRSWLYLSLYRASSLSCGQPQGEQIGEAGSTRPLPARNLPSPYPPMHAPQPLLCPVAEDPPKTKIPLRAPSIP